MKPIKLTKAQNRMMKVHKDSVVAKAKTYTEEEIQTAYENGEPLFPMLMSVVRRTVGRFMAHWKATRKFEDDMTSEGIYAIALLLDTLDDEMLQGRTVMNVAFTRVRDRIEEYLSQNITAISGPCLKTRKTHKIKDGQVFDVDDLHEEKHPEAEGDEWKRDILDALDHLKCHALDELDMAILSRPYWGETHVAISDEFDVPKSTVRFRRNRLYNLYLELVR